MLLFHCLWKSVTSKLELHFSVMYKTQISVLLNLVKCHPEIPVDSSMCFGNNGNHLESLLSFLAAFTRSYIFFYFISNNDGTSLYFDVGKQYMSLCFKVKCVKVFSLFQNRDWKSKNRLMFLNIHKTCNIENKNQLLHLFILEIIRLYILVKILKLYWTPVCSLYLIFNILVYLYPIWSSSHWGYTAFYSSAKIWVGDISIPRCGHWP